MKKMELCKAKSFVNFLETNKDLVGLSDYMVKFSMEPMKDPNSIARVEPDYLENTIKVQVNDDFLKLEKSRQANILLHELIHARIGIFAKKVDNFRLQEEELLVNDLTRGLERLYDKSFWERNI